MYTEDYEQEIDLKDLLFAVLYHWRILGLAAVVGAVLLAGYKQVKSGNEVSEETMVTEDYQDQLEQYKADKLALEDAIDSLKANMVEQNQYLAKAPLMQINPYRESVATAQVLVETADGGDRSLGSILQAYEQSLTDGSYLQDAAKKFDTETRYIGELVSVSSDRNANNGDGASLILQIQDDSTTKGLLLIQAIGADEEMSKQIMESVLGQMETAHEELNAEVKLHQLTILARTSGERVDRDLVYIQQTVRNNVTSLQRTLSDLKSSLDGLTEPVDVVPGETSAKDLLKYGILGFLAGGFLAVCAVAGLYLCNDKIRSDKEITDRFHIKSLGTFSVVPKKKVLGFVDSWLHRLAGDDKIWPDDLVYEMIGANTANYAEGKTKLFVTGLASENRMKEVCEHLKSALPGMEIITERNLVDSASARRQMADAEGVILVEERGVSRYSVIQQELELAGYVKTEVVGVVVV